MQQLLFAFRLFQKTLTAHFQHRSASVRLLLDLHDELVPAGLLDGRVLDVELVAAVLVRTPLVLIWRIVPMQLQAVVGRPNIFVGLLTYSTCISNSGLQ